MSRRPSKWFLFAWFLSRDSGILWKSHRNAWLPCVPELMVLSVLRMVHDQAAGMAVARRCEGKIESGEEAHESANPGIGGMPTGRINPRIWSAMLPTNLAKQTRFRSFHLHRVQLIDCRGYSMIDAAADLSGFEGYRKSFVLSLTRTSSQISTFPRVRILGVASCHRFTSGENTKYRSCTASSSTRDFTKVLQKIARRLSSSVAAQLEKHT